MSHITDLRDVIHKLHGAKAEHIQSVAVREMFGDRVVWDGVVEVFDLNDHPDASRVYAWAHETDDPDNPKRYVTVLHIPPVVSPKTAVQAAILQEYKTRAKSN